MKPEKVPIGPGALKDIHPSIHPQYHCLEAKTPCRDLESKEVAFQLHAV